MRHGTGKFCTITPQQQNGPRARVWSVDGRPPFVSGSLPSSTPCFLFTLSTGVCPRCNQCIHLTQSSTSDKSHCCHRCRRPWEAGQASRARRAKSRWRTIGLAERKTALKERYVPSPAECLTWTAVCCTAARHSTEIGMQTAVVCTLVVYICVTIVQWNTQY